MATKDVPTYCMQCVCGPDLLTVTVDEDGDLIGVEPNFDARGVHPADGRVCTKAYSLIDKANNPKRIRRPLRRSNPRKGWDEPPEWEEVTWDQAIELVADRIRDSQENGPVDDQGYPRIAATLGGGGISEAHFGTLPAFLSALDGYVDLSLGSGQGVACYHSEHIYHELWHRGFLAVPDITEAELVISFGANKQNTSGATGNWQYAQAKARGNLEYIHVEPHATTSAAWADEWIPIKPKTDAAFLYAMLHVVLHEMDWESLVDRPFLVERTNAPYLVAPDGYFLRDLDSGEPLLWDRKADRPVVHEAAGDVDPALTGTYSADGVTRGPDGAVQTYEDVSASPSFEAVLSATADVTPERAAGICDVPAERIRGVAERFVETAARYIGETVSVDGYELPYRPVGIMLGKTVNNGWGGYQACWSRMLLCALFGAIEVPGGLVSVGSRLNPPYHDKTASVRPGEDGFMAQSLTATAAGDWPEPPRIRGALTELTPMVGTDGWAQALSPATLAWLFQNEAPDGWPQPEPPDVWITYRTNPVLSFPDTDLVTRAIEDFPFVVDIAYTVDETNWFADLVIPDHTDLEGLQLKRIGGHNHAMDSFWETEGFALKQPVTEPRYDTIDMTELWSRLAEELGQSSRYLEAINNGIIMGVPLAGDGYDFSLDPDGAYDHEEIWDRLCKVASYRISDGDEAHGLAWFTEHGFFTREFPKHKHYLHPIMEEQGLRYEFPYQERLRRMGVELGRRLEERDVDWWDRQLEEYQAIPEFEDFAAIWEDFYGDEYGYWAITTKSIHYAYSNNVTNELSSEVARQSQEFEGVCLNRHTAAELGIEDGDPVRITSPFGEAEGDAILREGVRPDVILFVGQFGHTVTPHAKNLRIPNINHLTTTDDLELIDGTGSIAQIGRVAVEPVE